MSAEPRSGVDKPANFDAMVEAARAAANAARAAGATHETVKRSAARAARELALPEPTPVAALPVVDDVVKRRIDRDEEPDASRG